MSDKDNRTPSRGSRFDYRAIRTASSFDVAALIYAREIDHNSLGDRFLSFTDESLSLSLSLCPCEGIIFVATIIRHILDSRETCVANAHETLAKAQEAGECRGR
jgi:hypothetical protein